jgi:hypothetical protein
MELNFLQETTRRTFKVIGDHPIKGLIFENPIIIEISPTDDEVEVINENEAYLPKIVSETETVTDNIQPPAAVETPEIPLKMTNQSNTRPSRPN